MTISGVVVAADDLPRLLGVAHERERVAEDPLLESRVVRLALHRHDRAVAEASATSSLRVVPDPTPVAAMK